MNRSHLESNATIAAALLLMAVAPLTTAADYTPKPGTAVTPKQEFQSMQHEFELESGEKLLLAHRRTPGTFRVCVDTFKGSVPLKVFVDQKESEVAVASCETLQGKHVSVEAGAHLPPGEYLVGRFKMVKE